MALSKHLSEREVFDLCLSGAVDVQSIRTIKAGVLWQARLPDSTLAVKAHPAGTDVRHVLLQREAARRAHAAGANCHAPELIGSREVIVTEADRVFDASEWIDHDGAACDRRERLGAAASALAVLSDSLAGFQVGVAPLDAGWLPLDNAVDRFDAAAMACEKQSGDKPSAAAATLDLARRAADRVADSLLPELTAYRPTHGDYGGHNVLFAGDVCVGVVDFGRLDERPRLYDLAWLVFFDFLHDTPTTALWRSAQRYLTAFRNASRGEIDDETWATLPKLMAAIAIQGIASAIDETDPTGEVLAFGDPLPLVWELLDDPAPLQVA